MRTTDNLHTYEVQMAIQALLAFYQKHGTPQLEVSTIVEFAMAWRTCERFEWTPCLPSFRRITTVNPTAHQGKIALVFGYDGVSPELTDELNSLIKQFIRTCWGT